jgi:hypothetical protein
MDLGVWSAAPSAMHLKRPPACPPQQKCPKMDAKGSKKALHESKSFVFDRAQTKLVELQLGHHQLP